MTLLDKREEWGFVELGEVNVSAIQQELLGYQEEWLKDTSRQEFYETHESTFAFEVMSLPYGHNLEKAGVCTIKRKMLLQTAQDELASLISFLEDLSKGKVVRAEFINMKPNSRVRFHKDRSDLLYVSRRFHVPIKTNDQVFFLSEKEYKNLKQGNLYELNNIKYHSVLNQSSENRIHLIIDVLPEPYCGEITFKNE